MGKEREGEEPSIFSQAERIGADEDHAMALLRLRTFQQRLIALGAVLTVIPLLVLSVAHWVWMVDLVRQAREDSARQTQSGIANAGAILEASYEAIGAGLRERVRGQAGVAEAMLAERGGAEVIRGWNQAWTAREEESGRVVALKLPVVVVGDAARGPDSARKFVEAVREVTGAQVTVFQRMNAEGDMLRVATTVKLPDGETVAGTFVSRKLADGRPNPVIEAVLSGRESTGRAKVADQWGVTLYRPLKDRRGALIGMLFIGMPEGKTSAEHQAAVAAMAIGKTGVASAHVCGELRSRGDGLSQRIAGEAERLARGQQVVFRAAGGPGFARDGREHEFAVRYLREWDWVLVAGVPVEELLATASRLEERSRRVSLWASGLTGLASLAAALVWWTAARRWTSRISQMVTSVLKRSAAILETSLRLKEASLRLTEFRTREAEAVELAGPEIAELSRQSEFFSARAMDLSKSAAEVKVAAETGSERTRRVAGSMSEIEAAGKQVASILTVVNGIAQETSLLAINASIEAARAGRAGLGFAVVADGVRALAGRAGEAAGETSTLIARALNVSRQGVVVADNAASSLTEIEMRCVRLDDLAARLSEQIRVQDGRLEAIRAAMAALDSARERAAKPAGAGGEASRQLTEESRGLEAEAAQLAAYFVLKGERGCRVREGRGLTRQTTGRYDGVGGSSSLPRRVPIV